MPPCSPVEEGGENESLPRVPGKKMKFKAGLSRQQSFGVTTYAPFQIEGLPATASRKDNSL